MLTAVHHEQRMVVAFTTVVEYRPFCRYLRNGMVMVEWNKVVPDQVFAVLQRITGGQRIGALGRQIRRS